MGWTGYHATHYKNGEIDRKAECDAVFSGENENGKWEVLKSSMRGSTYYAAVRRTKPSGESYVFAGVALTSVDMKDYYNFSYKDMDESVGPGCYDCPKGILDLLSPTENEYALAWRARCREKSAKKNELSALPIGAVIEYDWYGTIKRAEKRAPNYQFKTAWYKIIGENKYVPKSRIPRAWKLVEATA